MGIDPAPFWANLYLHYHEYKYMLNTIKTNKLLALKYNGTFRFIDDLNAINDSGAFEKSRKEIYPKN